MPTDGAGTQNDGGGGESVAPTMLAVCGRSTAHTHSSSEARICTKIGNEEEETGEKPKLQLHLHEVKQTGGVLSTNSWEDSMQSQCTRMKQRRLRKY